MTHRPLTPAEISCLESNGCRCRDWSRIEVKEPFRPENYRNVVFAGTVRLGSTRDNSLDDASFLLPTGIRNATVADCIIGDNVVVSNVAALVGKKHDPGFGMCPIMNPLDETGSIEVTACEGLSAQSVDLFVRFRRDKAFIGALSRKIKEHASEMSSGLMTVENDAVITDCGEIRSVSVREGAMIRGASKLSNGIVGRHSSVGTDVIAENFIIGTDSIAENGVLLDTCFIGDGCHVRNGFTAHQSLIFSNSTFENGEAAAIIAKPFTVSMHKSTLLIGGIYSFFNAGSGSNQSNHLYNGGPMHWGIMERGCKMSSDSYVMWPARIGAFSMIMGRHIQHPDTSELPFSYIIENRGDTYVVPGATLRSVGTLRDMLKWPSRDRRSPSAQSDIINCDGLSAYTCGKMLSAIDLLIQIEAECECTHGVYTYRGLHMRESSVDKGKRIYMSAICLWLAKTLFPGGREAFESAVASDSRSSEWTDLGGQIVENSVVYRLHDSIADADNPISEAAAILSDAESLRSDAEYRYAAAIARRLSITSFDEICRRGAEAAEMFMTVLADDVAREIRLTDPAVSDAEIASAPLTVLVRRHFSSLPFMKNQN